VAPELALARGQWVKLICGASNHDLAAIEDLCALYGLVGVDCIDVAADPAAVGAARRGLAWAQRQWQANLDDQAQLEAQAQLKDQVRVFEPPWLMVSLSDGDDPHFRKASFDPRLCPSDCPRPCQRVCPALAIGAVGGVEADRCYGCGRCLPACPLGLIGERQTVLSAAAVPALLAELRPDAVEIHTRIGRGEAFAARLQQVLASGVPLRRLAVSCGLEHDGAGPASARQLASELWQRFGLLRQAGLRPLWQLDGRPMSGDVGVGTARAAVALLQAVRPWAPPGPLQLAGGTNGASLALLPPDSGAAGVAFGGRARSLLQPLLLEAEARGTPLRDQADLRRQALDLARGLVDPWRQRRWLERGPDAPSP
jgi:Fe-S-cluster-containing hydrogenase component 2